MNSHIPMTGRPLFQKEAPACTPADAVLQCKRWAGNAPDGTNKTSSCLQTETHNATALSVCGTWEDGADDGVCIRICVCNLCVHELQAR